MAQSQETQVNLKINRVPSKSILDNMVANNQLQPNQLYMIESEQGEGLVALQTKTLWTNPNPSSSFAAQTITINGFTDYDYYYVIATLDAGGIVYGGINSIISKIENYNYLSYWNIPYNNVFVRNIFPNGNEILFENTLKLADKSINNSVLVPYQIIGIKLINSPQDIYGWVDGQGVLLTDTQTTSETSIDMSSFINDYDENGEYECLIGYEYAKSNASVNIKLGSDIIALNVKINEIYGQYYQADGQMTIPLKKYLKYQNGATGLAYFWIKLIGYRRIK